MNPSGFESLTVASIASLSNAERKAFWINTYNLFFQLEAPNYPESGSLSKRIFKDPIIRLDGIRFSLDEVEHDLLRRGAMKYGFGFVRTPLMRKELKMLALESVDPSVHFALNCGANSCPPIQVFFSNSIDRELIEQTKDFLISETQVNAERETLHLNPIMLWYVGDFGGFSGLRQFLKKNGLKQYAHYRLRFKKFNREPSLAKFAIR